MQVSKRCSLDIADAVLLAICTDHRQRQPWRDVLRPAELRARNDLVVHLLVPLDRALLALPVAFPLDVGVDPNGIAVVPAGDRIDDVVDQARRDIVLVVFRTNHLLDFLRECFNRQLLADHHLQWIAHWIPLADVAVQVEAPQTFRRNMQQAVAANDQMQQRLMENHAVIAGLDLTQHLPLDLTQRLLKISLLLWRRAHHLQLRFIQREPEELLRRR